MWVGAVFRSETWVKEGAWRTTGPMKPMFMGERIRQDVSTHLNRIISTHFEHLLIDVRVIHWHKVCSLHKKVPCCLNYLPTLMQRYTFLFIRLSFASTQNVFVIHISPPHQQLFYSISDLARAGWRPNGAQGKRSDTLGDPRFSKDGLKAQWST